MKKIFSRYYFFVAIILVIAYQYFSGLVLHSDFAASLSDFSYYFSDMMLNFLVVLLVFIFMVGAGKWQQITQDHSILSELLTDFPDKKEEDFATIYGGVSSYLAADYSEFQDKIFYQEIEI